MCWKISKRFIILVTMPAKMKSFVFPGLSFPWGALASRVLPFREPARALARLLATSETDASPIQGRLAWFHSRRAGDVWVDTLGLSWHDLTLDIAKTRINMDI